MAALKMKKKKRKKNSQFHSVSELGINENCDVTDALSLSASQSKLWFYSIMYETQSSERKFNNISRIVRMRVMFYGLHTNSGDLCCNSKII